MRLQHCLAVAVAAGSLAIAQPAVAAPTFSDIICPRAVPKVMDFAAAGATNDAAKIAVASRAAAEAYQLCASDAQVAKGVAIEPTVNYDKTRAAQFLVVEGRALAAGGNSADALTVLKNARRLADDVATWQPESQTWHASASTGAPGGAPRGTQDDVAPAPGSSNSAAHSSDHDGSRYKEAAVQVRDAADGEIGKLAPPKS